MKHTLLIVVFSCLSGIIYAQSKIKFSAKDSVKLNYCTCDSLSKSWKVSSKNNNDNTEYDGNGWAKYYNFKNEIGQCGYFNKFYFIYGLHYLYDEDGKLSKIKKYLNGKLVGVCDLKKK